MTLADQLELLIVDDVPSIVENISMLLSLHPQIRAIRSASDGIHAIEAVERNQPDVIVMDIRMPRLDGITAAREIRKRFPEVAIVIHSAYEDAALMDQIDDIGVERFFLKGSPVRDLIAHVLGAHKEHMHLQG